MKEVTKALNENRVSNVLIFFIELICKVIDLLNGLYREKTCLRGLQDSKTQSSKTTCPATEAS